jgi:hypothetical protein
MTIECDEVIPPIGMATASDNCGIVFVTYVGETGSGDSCDSLIVRTYYAEDACGNSAICTQQIRILDTTPPSIVCPLTVIIECHETIPTTLATATDNCNAVADVTYVDEINEQECSQQVIVEGVPKVLYVIVRTHYATDDCGNVSSCTQHIIIRDDTPPVVVCPPNITIDCNDPTDPEFTGFPTVTDNCDPNPVPVYVDLPPVGNSCDRTITRVWSATDWCGN